MLACTEMSVRIGAKSVLRQVSLAVEPGTVLAVVGPNGAGKSTLLKTLSGEIEPDQGEVRMNGRLLSDMAPLERARLRAVLPQDSSLGFSFLVDEVVAMGRDPHRGAGRARDRKVVEAALEATDALHLLGREYTTLSGGERQRVHFARVLAQVWEPIGHETRYLLLDEPTSALDLAHQHHGLATARRMAHEQGIGVFAILHDLNLASCYADQVALLKCGQLVSVGPPSEVLTRWHIRETFGIPVTVLDHPVLSRRPLIVAIDPSRYPLSEPLSQAAPNSSPNELAYEGSTP